MIKLHLGCFDQVVDGWVNTDVTPHILVARVPGLAFAVHKLGKMSTARYEQHREQLFRRVRYLNVARRFPFDDGAVEHVYSSHMLEHLPRHDAERCIREVYRVLRPGGVVRIAIPDLDSMVAHYDATDPESFLKEIFENDHPRAKNRHHWHYNEKSLHRLLTEIGFSRISRCHYRQGDCADLDRIDTRPENSLYVEAIK